MSPAVSTVVDLLSQHGFRSLEIPVTIGPIEHDFPAVLLGNERSLDLVVVIDTVAESDEKRIRQRIRGLAHALDVVNSKRSLSVVVVGPRLTAATAAAVGDVARVLNVGPSSDSEAANRFREALAVLLPLELPAATTGPADALGVVRKQAGHDNEAAFLRALVAAAPSSAEAVALVLKKEMDRSLRIAEEGSE